MTRKQNSAESEAPQPDAAAPAIPPGVQADVNIKYKTHVDPNQAGTRSQFHQSMLDAAEELEAEDSAPLDELSTFCYRFAQFAGYPLRVVRLPDPPGRLMPGSNYVRRCSTIEQLGAVTFDPTNLIQALQSLNRDSGGIFRIWLTDYDGAPIPDARIMVLGIADPPRDQVTIPAQTQPAQQLTQPQPLPPHEKSESEKQLESVKDTLFQTALSRALNPVPLTGAQTPQLPPDQQAMLYLLGNSELVPNLVKQMTEIATQAAGAGKEPTWKDRAIDAGAELVTKNPAIIEKVGDIALRFSGVVERIFARMLPDPRYDAVGAPLQQQQINPQAPPIYYQQQPPPVQQPPSSFTPDPGPPDAPIDEDDDEDMDIIEALTALLNSDKPLTVDEPIFKELETAYPKKFRDACNALARFPLEITIRWIVAKGGPVYASMFSGPVSGPYLRGRLAELQTLIVTAQQAAKERATQAKDAKPEPAKPTETSEANAQAEG